MKITHFFIFLFLFSASLLIFLEPQSYAVSETRDIPKLALEDFTLYEINQTGVQSVVSGTLIRQFTSYYEVENAHYIENKNKIGEHLYADFGRFEGDVAYLHENVRYFREDGLSFESDNAIYDTENELLYVPNHFTLTQNENVIYGTELHYNAHTGNMKAEKINANYYIQETDNEK